MKHKPRTDRNQSEIVKALRAKGYCVLSLASVGKGVPDLLVGHAGHNYLIEVKDGKKPPSSRALTPDQRAFHETWTGHVCVVTCAEDAVNAVSEGNGHATDKRR